MPTENRSSNTEISWSPAKPSAPGAYWVRGNGLEQDALIQIINDDGELRCNLHRPTTETDFGYGYAVSELSDDFEWLGPLRASPAPQPHPEPIAWMVGTAIWWTKEEAERDAAATGLPVVGLGPMVDPVVADRLSTATAFVQRMVECAGTQQSVATGYVRDILDVLKGNATPSAPVELQRMSFEYVHADGDRRTVSLSREEVAGYMDEFLFEKLTETLCQCEPIGETNVVDCRCDEVAEQFSLVKPS